MLDIETHTDGTFWIKCKFVKHYFGTVIPSANSARQINLDGKVINIYHPNYEEINESNCGSDSEYQCKDCGKTWWVERDG